MLKKKLNIFYNIAENSGVGYYRQYLPAIALREKGLANVLINDFTWGEVRLFCSKYFPDCKHIMFGYNPDIAVSEYVKHLRETHNKIPNEQEVLDYRGAIVDMVEPAIETLNKIGHWADLLVIGRRDTSGYLSQWKGISQFFNIPLVWDTDDNVHATRPFNPGYRGYYPGAESLIWNKKTAQEANAITVSTEHLRQVHLKDNKNIYVIPNALEFQRWKDLPKPKFDGEIRIGFLVSSSHHEDAKLLIDVIPAILKKYPKAHFYFTGIFGYIFEQAVKDFPKQMHIVDWYPLKKWPEGVCSLGLDIGLAPLVDNLFNRAKSNLRYLEYSAAKVASVVSPVEPYSKTVKHGKTGLFASTTKEWVNYISTLVEDEKYRRKLALAAQRFVEKNFDVYKNANKNLEIYKRIITDFKRFNGKRKFNFQKDVFKQPEKAEQISALV